MDPRLSYSVTDEESRIMHKHQALLQEYLVLQKEVVSRKRKLRETQERKLTLKDEVRFLKRRRAFLLKNQSVNPAKGKEQELAQSHVLDGEYSMDHARDKLYSGSEAALLSNPSTSSRPLWDLDLNHKARNGIAKLPQPIRAKNKEVVLEQPLRIGKQTKNMSANGKRIEKRKISWQDQLVLKA